MQPWQYIALLGAVIAVTAVILPKNKNSSKLANHDVNKQIEQMELSFEQFMDNMEKDHDELVKMLSSSLQTMKEEDRLKSDQIARLEKKCAELEEHISSLSHENVALNTKVSFLSSASTLSNNVEVAASDEMIESEAAPIIDENSIYYRYAELFDMYNSGKSVETIAKKLGKNKGEVQLILQLAKQEESARHA